MSMVSIIIWAVANVIWLHCWFKAWRLNRDTKRREAYATETARKMSGLFDDWQLALIEAEHDDHRHLTVSVKGTRIAEFVGAPAFTRRMTELILKDLGDVVKEEECPHAD